MDSRRQAPQDEARGAGEDGHATGGAARPQGTVADAALAERALRGLAWLAAILMAGAGAAFLAARWGGGA